MMTANLLNDNIQPKLVLFSVVMGDQIPMTIRCCLC